MKNAQESNETIDRQFEQGEGCPFVRIGLGIRERYGTHTSPRQGLGRERLRLHGFLSFLAILRQFAKGEALVVRE